MVPASRCAVIPATCRVKILITTNGHVTKVGDMVRKVIIVITFIVTDGDGGVGITFTKRPVRTKFGPGGDGVVGAAGGARSAFKSFVTVKITIGISFGPVGHGGVHKLVCYGTVNRVTSFVADSRIVA